MGLVNAGWAQTYAHLLRLADALVIVLALTVAFAVSGIEWTSPLSGGQGVKALAIPLGVIALGIAFVWFVLLEVTGSRRADSFGQGPSEFARVLNATGLLLIVVSTASFLARAETPRLFLGFSLASGLVLALLSRALGRRFLWYMRSRDKMKTTIFLVGTTQSNKFFHTQNSATLGVGYRVVGKLNFQKADLQSQGFVESVISKLGRDEGEADLVVLTKPQLSTPQLRDALSARLELLAKGLALGANPEEIATTSMRLRLVPGAPLIRVRDVQLGVLAALYKRAFDLSLSIPALVVLFPFFVLIGFLIKVDSPGPVFFRQTRVGQFGREFSIVKFRTMVVDAEDLRQKLGSHRADVGNEVLFKMKDDPRVTGVGMMLRAASIDELPQLFNILRGDMSLVGPRPPLPSEVAMYEGQTHRRLAAKPGLTGLWQISGRSDLDWDESLRLDLQYVENWSPIADFIILLKTWPAVLRGKGAY